MYCSNCGAELKEDDEFCPYCGAKVRKDNHKLLNNVLNIVSMVYAIITILMVITVLVIGKSLDGMSASSSMSDVMSKINDLMSFLRYVPYIYYALMIGAGIMIVIYFLYFLSHLKEKYLFLFMGCYVIIGTGYALLNDIIDLVTEITRFYGVLNNGGVAGLFNYNGFDQLERLLGTINSNLPTYEFGGILIAIGAIALLIIAVVQRLCMSDIISLPFFKMDD